MGNLGHPGDCPWLRDVRAMKTHLSIADEFPPSPVPTPRPPQAEGDDRQGGGGEGGVVGSEGGVDGDPPVLGRGVGRGYVGFHGGLWPPPFHASPPSTIPEAHPRRQEPPSHACDWLQTRRFAFWRRFLRPIRVNRSMPRMAVGLVKTTCHAQIGLSERAFSGTPSRGSQTRWTGLVVNGPLRLQNFTAVDIPADAGIVPPVRGTEVPQA